MQKDTPRTPFGVLLVAIREGRKESQEAFADWLNSSRSKIGNYETKVAPSDEFVKLLKKRLPKLKPQIDAAVQLTKDKQALKPKRQADNPAITRIDGQIAAGLYADAADALYRELDNNERADWHTMFHLTRRYGHVTARLGRLEEGLPNLDMALFLGELMNLGEDELLPIWVELIEHLQKLSSKRTLLCIDDALWRFPHTDAIWRSKGTVHLFEHDYSGAYAALTTALHYSKTPVEIYLIRGRVLSEWAHYQEAIAELEKAFSSKGISTIEPFLLAGGRVALAHAFAELGNFTRSFQEFDNAETVTRINANLAYFRGVCYNQLRQRDKAINELSTALAIDDDAPFDPSSPGALTPQRRQEARQILAHLRKNEPYPPSDWKRYKLETTFYTQKSWRLKEWMERYLKEMDK